MLSVRTSYTIRPGFIEQKWTNVKWRRNWDKIERDSRHILPGLDELQCVALVCELSPCVIPYFNLDSTLTEKCIHHCHQLGS